MIRKWLKREPVVRVIMGGGLTVFFIGLYFLGSFEWLELRSYDLRYALLPNPPLKTPILLVRIDEDSETKLNVRSTDISRATYADAVKHLTKGGAALIVFDVIFSRPRDQEGDAYFARTIAQAGNVILARYIGEKGHKTPLPIFREAERGEALINVTLDRDGVLRSMPLVGLDYSVEGPDPEPVLAMSLEVARHYMDPSGEQELELGDPLAVGSLRIPNPEGKMRINYYGPPATFPRIPFWRAATGDLTPDEVRGKIVLIGASAPSLHDYYKTPFGERKQLTLSGQAEATQGVRMDGFEIHANAIQTILDRSFITRSADQWGLVPALMIGLGFLGTTLLMKTWNKSLLIEVFRAAILVGIGAVALLLFWWSRYWLDIVPLYSLVAAQYSAAVSYQRYMEGKKRREVQAMFGRYVSQRVVEQLIKNPDMANPSGRKERLTMFFSDVRGFTSMSEKMEPQEVQQLLSEYFTEMTRILFKHGGTLDKFMGDAVMAFFGNPEPQPDHALRAVLMALEMQECVTGLNQKWSAEGRRTIGVGMGIDTGDVTVGNLGSKDFLDYTVIGDHVNLACRLEQNAKAGEIIITQATYDEVKHAVEVEPMEPVKVKGKAEPIPIYRVLRRFRQG
ncbi:MAG TPA: adenylate/guanylate cyclase domain-containing protein [Nitrospiraceae bacterium]|nr:adenylate/guanylate cyclase domain-containing protein [Nitrospiraceae bacterium]